MKIEKGGLAIGYEPRIGLQSADDVVYDNGGEGPGEQMLRLEVGRGFPKSSAREHVNGDIFCKDYGTKNTIFSLEKELLH